MQNSDITLATQNNDPTAAISSPETLNAFCTQRMEGVQKIRKSIADLAIQTDSNLTWDQTFGALDQLVHNLQLIGGIAELMSVTHPETPVRDAAKTWSPKISEFVTEFYMDKDLYTVFKKASSSLNLEKENHKRLVEDTLRDYRRNGLDLPPEKQTRLRELNEKITKVGQDFESNLASAVGSIEIKPEQLEGLAENFKASHKPGENGLIKITTQTPDRMPFMKYAKDRAAAKQLYIQSNIRAKDTNLPLLDEILQLRQEKAMLLGYPTWADYVLEPRMAKNAKTVRDFLEDLKVSIKPVIAKDIQLMRQAAGLDDTTPIPISDAAYLDNLACEKHFALDSQEVSQYFEFSRVKQGLLDVTARVFGVTIVPRPDLPTWHPDVEPIEIQENGTVLGRIYLDLHPRADKYQHAAVFGLREAMKQTDESRLIAISALVCNFPKPSEVPALLQHEDVITFFHEFGHALHHTFSQAELSTQAGTNVARDFVEAPSQLFEEYAWDKSSLDQFAKHVETDAAFPEDLYAALTKSRDFGKGIDTAVQIFYATIDQEYHTQQGKIDTNATRERLFKDHLPFESIPNTYFQANFGHLIGYDAGYYGYQWARAIAFDLLTKIQSEGLFNQPTTKSYRDQILAQGSSREEQKLVEDFLGRPFSNQAYKKFLGV